VRAGREARGRPLGLQDPARRERRDERPALDGELQEPEGARIRDRQRERDRAVHERVGGRERRPLTSSPWRELLPL
jgi:hypothetical protein